MIKIMTLIKLTELMKDYDYELTLEQAEQILDLFDDYFGTDTFDTPQMCTDYIVNGDKSIFAEYF